MVLHLLINQYFKKRRLINASVSPLYPLHLDPIINQIQSAIASTEEREESNQAQ